MINPARGDERIKADVDQLALPLIIGEPADLAMLGEPPATTTVVDLESRHRAESDCGQPDRTDPRAGPGSRCGC